jgi:hypothetical protein
MLLAVLLIELGIYLIGVVLCWVQNYYFFNKDLKNKFLAWTIFFMSVNIIILGVCLSYIKGYLGN